MERIFNSSGTFWEILSSIIKQGDVPLLMFRLLHATHFMACVLDHGSATTQWKERGKGGSREPETVH